MTCDSHQLTFVTFRIVCSYNYSNYVEGIMKHHFTEKNLPSCITVLSVYVIIGLEKFHTAVCVCKSLLCF